MAVFFDWIRKYRKHVVEVGPALALYETFNFVYDRVFYPFALAHWGFKLGITIGVAGSVLCCATLFWLYDVMKIDWLRAHAARQLENKKNKSHLERLMSWVGSEKKTVQDKLAGFLLLLGITWIIDPLIVAIYFRRLHFQGVNLKDWAILFLSVSFANLWWILSVTPFVLAFKFITHQHL